MSQTILAIAAMLAVTLLSFQQQRAVLDMYADMVEDENEVMAVGIALQVKSQILSKPFDGQVAQQQNVTPAQFTEEGTFGPGESSGGSCKLYPGATGTFEVCDDLDDYHGIEWETVPYVLDGETIDFEASVSVRYVDPSDPAGLASGPTCHKEVRVRVRGADLIKGLKGQTPKVYELGEVVEHPYCNA